MPPELVDPQDYQSANLEKDVFDHTGILRKNPTRFDAIIHGTTDEAKDLERRFPVWLAQIWQQLNNGRRWDAAVGEGQVRHGIKIPWLRWRSQAGRQNKRLPFYWSYTNIQGCSWTHGEDGLPDGFIYSYDIPVVEADIKRDGKKVTLDQAGKIGWLDLAVSHEKYVEGKKLSVIVSDERDLEAEECEEEWCKFAPHAQRKITIYVCPEGKTNDAEYVEEFDSPFPVCSFFLVGGNVSEHETDPHWKYRPLMLPALNEQFWQNTLKSLLATEARQAHGDQDIYADASTLKPEHVGMFQEGGVAKHIDLPDGTKIPILPSLSRFPRNVDPNLMALLTRSEEAMVSYRPNILLTGQAHGMASNATGTAFLASLEQAGLPYDSLLTNSDAIIKLSLESILHALCKWAMADPDEAPSRYSVPVTGEVYTMRNSNAFRPGQTVYIEPRELMKYDWDIVLKTESKSKAEQQQAAINAYEGYDRGFLSEDDVFKALDVYDIEAQKEVLFVQGIREDISSDISQLTIAYLRQKAAARGFNVDAIIARFQQQQQLAQQGGTPPGPNPAGGPNNLTTAPNNIQGRASLRTAPEAQMARSQAGVQAQVNGARPELQGGTQT